RSTSANACTHQSADRSSAFESKPKNICSLRDLPVLTPTPTLAPPPGKGVSRAPRPLPESWFSPLRCPPPEPEVGHEAAAISQSCWRSVDFVAASGPCTADDLTCRRVS